MTRVPRREGNREDGAERQTVKQYLLGSGFARNCTRRSINSRRERDIMSRPTQPSLFE